jgi:hypothetical protein
MNAIAPVCPISRDQPISGSPGLLYPVLPAVIDLPSAIAAVNMLAPYVYHLGGVPFPVNNVYPPHLPTQTALKKNNSAGIQKRNWVVTKRTTYQQKIYKGDYGSADPDTSLWVEVERIKQMHLRDTVTGWTLEFNY